MKGIKLLSILCISIFLTTSCGRLMNSSSADSASNVGLVKNKGKGRGHNNCKQASAFDQGNGTSADPYIICQLSHLDEIRNQPGSYYRLDADIDATGTATMDGGKGFMPIAEFTGHLDGNGHTISGLHINREMNTGLIGLLTNGGEVKNLILDEIDIIGTYVVGGIAGEVDHEATITNSSVSGNISGNAVVGLIAGDINYYAGLVSRCSSSGTVSVTMYDGGGIAGMARSLIYGLDRNSSSASISGPGRIGGLVGHTISSGKIKNSYATGSVTATAIPEGLSGHGIGGLVGLNYMTNLENVYATGPIVGGMDTGSLIGEHWEGDPINFTTPLLVKNVFLKSSFAFGQVVGSLTYNGQGKLENVYYLNTSSQPAVCYFAQILSFTDYSMSEVYGNEGCTTVSDRSFFADQSQPLYQSWDFAGVWVMDAAEGLPKLR